MTRSRRALQSTRSRLLCGVPYPDSRPGRTMTRRKLEVASEPHLGSKAACSRYEYAHEMALMAAPSICHMHYSVDLWSKYFGGHGVVVRDLPQYSQIRLRYPSTAAFEFAIRVAGSSITYYNRCVRDASAEDDHEWLHLCARTDRSVASLLSPTPVSPVRGAVRSECIYHSPPAIIP